MLQRKSAVQEQHKFRIISWEGFDTINSDGKNCRLTIYLFTWDGEEFTKLLLYALLHLNDSRYCEDIQAICDYSYPSSICILEGFLII